MSNNTQPEIRFPGFTDDWEQRKLKEFGKSTGGTSIESEFVEGGKYKVISIGSYSEQSVYTDQNIRAELTDKTRNRVLNKGDLTMILNDKTASGNIIGRVLLIDSNDSYVYNQRTERIEPDHKKYDSQFLYHMLNAPMIRSKIIKQAQGNTQIYVNWSAIGELDYLVPNLDEQREIGAFFFNLNNLITLHQRKLDLLKETKKGFLQKMFPKNGAKVPEIRFPGFTGDWEEKKFKEVINSGIKGKAKAEMSGTKSLYLDTNYLNGGVVTYVDSPRDVENDDVLILWDGSQAGTVYYGFSGALGSTLKAYRAKESGAFLYQQLKRNQQIIYDRYRTPNIPHVVKTFTDEFMVSMPSSEEQQKIGAFFKQLDDTIALHQRKLDLLKETKKGFLQKMFV
ncbi:TPA: restriction endonuclease subunit S [Enterococcus faecium]|uniref:restriction endonuclease subunit S n=3 Tax=Enterococcus faecium TaxID=1352 RepID=UPI00383FA98C